MPLYRQSSRPPNGIGLQFGCDRLDTESLLEPRPDQLTVYDDDVRLRISKYCRSKALVDVQERRSARFIVVRTALVVLFTRLTMLRNVVLEGVLVVNPGKARVTAH